LWGPGGFDFFGLGDAGLAFQHRFQSPHGNAVHRSLHGRIVGQYRHTQFVIRQCIDLIWFTVCAGSTALSPTRPFAKTIDKRRPVLEAQAMSSLKKLGWLPDCIAIRRQADLGPPQAGDALVVLRAARTGRTRLIDSLET
jgi:hypothetical protein